MMRKTFWPSVEFNVRPSCTPQHEQHPPLLKHSNIQYPHGSGSQATLASFSQHNLPLQPFLIPSYLTSSLLPFPSLLPLIFSLFPALQLLVCSMKSPKSVTRYQLLFVSLKLKDCSFSALLCPDNSHYVVTKFCSPNILDFKEKMNKNER